MRTPQSDGKARAVFSLMVLCGGGLLSIPFFLKAPAYLDLVLRDSVFASDLTGRQATVTHDGSGKIATAPVQKVGNDYLARVGRIDSGIGGYTVRVDGFKSGNVRVDAAPLQQVRAGVELRPAFGRLEITPVNATIAGDPVAATIRAGTRSLTKEPERLISVDLPPGRHRLAAQAPGFCATEREFEVREAKVTTARFPLSPDLQGDEIARFVLNWTSEPRDLDAHFRKSGTAGGSNPAHAYFRHKEAFGNGREVLARLDVDEQRPNGYETVTVRDNATGDFEYYVHLYAGDGTIGSSGATVQAYLTGCRVKTFPAPSSCAQNIWTVANIRNRDGRVELLEQQRCETSPALLFGGKAPILAP